jgi:rod shape-determining protein MreC
MLKRPHYIALSVVVFLVLVVLNLPSQTATQFKLAMSTVFLPLFGLATSLNHLTEQAGNALTPRRALLNELEHLRRDNAQFRARQTQVAQVFRENDQLRQALHLQRQLPWKVQFARVSFRDPANWWRTVQIDVGQQDGVINDLPVLTMDGMLVGRTRQVGSRSSQVVLVGDCEVSALVDDGKTRDFGVIASGAGNVLDASLVDLTYVNRPTASKPGQPVYTSGLGGIFPRGILIGHIVDTNNVGFGLYTEARVKLGANLDSLEEVWVVLR